MNQDQLVFVDTPLDIAALLRKIRAGWRPEFVCFWGHQAYPGEKAGKHVLSQWWESPFEIGAPTACDGRARSRPCHSADRQRCVDHRRGLRGDPAG